MFEPPIERDGARSPPLGIKPRTFLRDYWQRRPLLVRRALAGFRSPLTPQQLAGLAGEVGESARLVVHQPRGDRWTLRHGPFDARDFARLPQRDWTLLVQDCDKYVAQVHQLLDEFRFLPSWRIDDVMISYAADRGSVGAHIDQYDVFLLQGLGRRRWRISIDPAAPTAFRPDVELKLLARFEPTHEFVLEPGDMLYLPPGVPHHGIAEGPCMTYSIGMRAPSVAELLLDWSETLAEGLGEERRYGDAASQPARDPGRIDAATLARVEALLRAATAGGGRAALADWFGRYITRYRSAGAPVPRRRRLDPASLGARLARGARLRRTASSRYAWLGRRGGADLYLAGERHGATVRLARLLDAGVPVDAHRYGALSAAERATLTALCNAGHLVIERD